MILVFIATVLCAGIVVSALLAVHLSNTVSAAISAGMASLFAAIIYVVLAAPDVAMTEAAIGSGLTTVIFLFAIRRTMEPPKK
jgi:energy-converting hydrogenase B subunit D